MRYFSLDKLDFKTHELVEIQVMGGSRPRLVLRHKKTRQLFFLKGYSHNPREIWAEMISSRLGLLADIPIQQVSIKLLPPEVVRVLSDKNPKPIGALVRNIFPKDHEIFYGSQILGTASEPVALEEIEAKIRKLYVRADDLLQAFSDMIIFDAWIGNMDRHHENWGISQHKMFRELQLSLLPDKTEWERQASRREFSALYDHGSSLLFELDDNKVSNYLKDLELFKNSYIVGKKYSLLRDPSGAQQNVFELIKIHLNTDGPWKPRLRKSMKKIISIDPLRQAQVILQMPENESLEYSHDRKRLLYYSLEERKLLLRGLI